MSQASSTAVEALLARYIAQREVDGTKLETATLAADRPELVSPLARAIACYEALDGILGEETTQSRQEPEPSPPALDGFRVIERIGAGGMGIVYKLFDETLGRTVAAKVLRRDRSAVRGYTDFLREARALALFDDPRIVRIYELRENGPESVLLMELVEGFALDKIAPSLEMRQRARLVREVCDALESAHARGLQHRDLKPANILVDATLQPRIVDFGLASDDPTRGHGLGTPAYLAPEQLDRSRPIDARTDVHALGAVLYQLTCGARPFDGPDTDAIVEAIRTGRPRLPTEIDPSVPEPLQAIALQAMDPRPDARYPSAGAMARDLDRYLDGRPVTARPTLYRQALRDRLQPHIDTIREWCAQRLIYDHEADRLRAAYRPLVAREDDWIVESRRLSWPQIALYLGAFLLIAGGLFYFEAHRARAAGTTPLSGFFSPWIALGLPFAGLTAAALWLDRASQRAVAVAFFLATAGILPMLLVLGLADSGLLPPTARAFFDGSISNRQLQLASVVAGGWALVLTHRTRTVALASLFTALVGTTALAIAADLGLRRWLEDGRFDRLGLFLLGLVAAYLLLARQASRRKLRNLAVPLHVGAATVFVVAIELLALDGRAAGWLGLTFASWQGDVSDPTLLPTVLTMTVNGLLIYSGGHVLERLAGDDARAASRLLFLVAPFAALEPLLYLNVGGEHPDAFLWLHLGLALAVALASQLRQRKSFYLAGLLNTGLALYLIADRHGWLDTPVWAVAVLAAGAAALTVGLVLDRRARNRRQR